LKTKFSITIGGIIFILVVTLIIFSQSRAPDVELEEKNVLELEQFTYDFLKPEEGDWVSVASDSLFKTYVKKDSDYYIEKGKTVFTKVLFQLKPELTDLYEELRMSPDFQNIAVVFPIFTASAYSEPGFYTYYRNECDDSCLTTEIKNVMTSQSNPTALQVFNLLDYNIISDIDIDKNPDILNQYDKIILLHNEYVTQREFDAITSHPKVIYLYPNALYAKIETDYNQNTITLIRGHGYPQPEIRNGFNWEFENSELEYDYCLDPEFYSVDNGWMLNCYPENEIHKNLNLLKLIKNL